MATSGTATFNLDLPELIEEAYERCGLEARGGYDLRTARRSLNLMMADWANRGINLWTVDERTQLLTTGAAAYTLDADIVDLIEVMVRLPEGISTRNQTDYPVTRASVSTYATRSSKLVQGRPTEIWIDRQRGAPVVTLWPVPDRAYTLVYWVLRRMEDAGAYVSDMDVPFRFLEPLIAGLAARIAAKKAARVPADLRTELRALAVAAFDQAAMEDREKATLRLVPQASYRC